MTWIKEVTIPSAVCCWMMRETFTARWAAVAKREEWSSSCRRQLTVGNLVFYTHSTDLMAAPTGRVRSLGWCLIPSAISMGPQLRVARLALALYISLVRMPVVGRRRSFTISAEEVTVSSQRRLWLSTWREMSTAPHHLEATLLAVAARFSG